MVLLEVVAGKSQGLGALEGGRLVEQADDHGLAVDRGQGRQAQVDVAVLDADVGAAVLGHAALRDVHAAHDLEARDDAGLEVARHSEHVAHEAVDAHAHLEVALARLEVEVGRALDGGALDDGVDQAYGGRGLAVVV